MLSGETRLLANDQARPIKDVRENCEITGAMGWGETGKTVVSDIFVQFDHKGPVLTLTTSKGAILKCSPDQSCFARLNPLSRVYYLFLMERSSLGFKVGLSNDLMRDVFAMQSMKSDLFNQQEVTDRLWIIEASENQAQACFLEKYATFKYGLPNIPFSDKHAQSELSDNMIRELFNRIDTPSRAHQMLMDWLMFEDFPHITVRLSKTNPAASNAIQFILFGGAEKTRKQNGFVHLIRIDSSIELNRAEHKQFKRRMSSRGLWNLEVTRDDLEEAQLFVKTLSCLDNLEVIKKIQLTKKAPFYILPASHVKTGMTVPILGDRGIEEDTVVSISVEDYQGPLFDLKVEALHNYIAGQWVVMAYSGSLGPNARKSLERSG